jgi:hypothetical protein
VYAPDAIVYHSHPLTLASFTRQHFGYGEGAWRFRRRRSDRRGEPTRLESPAFYAGMIRAPFDERDPEAFWISMLLLLSQAAGALGLLSAGMHKDRGPDTRTLRLPSNVR